MSTNEAMSQATEQQPPQTPGAGCEDEGNRSVQETATIRLCLEEIGARARWALGQKTRYNDPHSEDPEDDYAYEYYDGMADAYGNALAILRQHIKDKTS